MNDICILYRFIYLVAVVSSFSRDVPHPFSPRRCLSFLGPSVTGGPCDRPCSPYRRRASGPRPARRPPGGPPWAGRRPWRPRRWQRPRWRAWRCAPRPRSCGSWPSGASEAPALPSLGSPIRNGLRYLLNNYGERQMIFQEGHGHVLQESRASRDVLFSAFDIAFGPFHMHSSSFSPRFQ